MKFFTIFFVLSIVAVSSTYAQKQPPPGFKLCKRSDPKIAGCLKEAMTDVLSLLKNGIKDLGVPDIEPLYIDAVSVEQGGNSAVNLKQSFKDAYIHHLTDSVVQRTAVKFDKFAMKTDAYTPRMDFVGDYKMEGKILVLPITGNGKANVSMHQLTTRHELRGDTFTKDDGNVYLNITSYKIKFTPKYVTFFFGNLFNGDKLLGDTMNNFMNQNWQPVFEGLIPGYELHFGNKFREIANLLFHKIPMKLIFLD
ncbi:unnamed protein product [Diamesa hyperborea]